MTIHTPIRRIRTRQYVEKLKAQSISAQEGLIASNNLPHNVELRPAKAVESDSLRLFDFDNRSDIKSEAPLLLSPTGTVSTASSPGTGENIWDSPLPSSHHLSQPYSNAALTPLTPPSAHDASLDSTPTHQACKAFPVKGVKEEATRDTVATLNASCCAKTTLRVDAAQDEDYFFKPQKLIRNLTTELQAIADANAVAAQPRYNLRPDFNFGGAAKSNSSARPRRSMVTTRHDAKSEETKSHIKVEFIAAVDDNSLPSTRKSSKSLHGDLEHIVPMTIQSRFTEKRGKCVASKVGKPHERCFYNSPGGNIAIMSRELLRCDFEVDPLEFLEHIERLIQAFMCGIHRKVALSSKRQEKLKDLVTNFVHLSSAERTEFQAWLDAIAHGTLPVKVPIPTVYISRKDTKSVASKIPKTLGVPVAPSATKTSLASDTRKQAHTPGFTAYQPKCTQDKSVSTALFEEIIKPLKPSALKDGFIYVFWDNIHFGKVKIGRTNDLERRLKEWNRDCNRIHMYHPASQRGELSKIPHVSRIERLIHIELKNCREQKYCPSCNKHHQEWFNAKEALVTEIFHKWQDWIIQKPYAIDAITGEWTLRPEIMDTLAQVCQPLALVENQPPLRRAGGTKGQKKA